MWCGLKAGASGLSSSAIVFLKLLREKKKKFIFCFALLCKSSHFYHKRGQNYDFKNTH